MLGLEMYPLIMPGHREYANEDVPVLAAELVERILSTNCHGLNHEKHTKGTSELLPSVSMMNHASKPNCSFMPVLKDEGQRSIMIVITDQFIKKGNELTMKYQTDSIVKHKWGIS